MGAALSHISLGGGLMLLSVSLVTLSIAIAGSVVASVYFQSVSLHDAAA